MPRLSMLLIPFVAAVAATCPPAGGARATTGGPEQLIPDGLPIPFDALWLGVEPFGVGLRLTGKTGWKPDHFANYARSPGAGEEVRGAVMSFPTEGFMENQYIWAAEGAKPLLPSGTAPVRDGLTVSAWVRYPAPTRLAGLNPVVAFLPTANQPFAATDQPDWGLAVMLKDGVPTVIVEGDATPRFTSGSFPKVDSHSVDDGAWHHLAFRLTRRSDDGERAHCRASLYVDGAWRGDEILSVPLNLGIVTLGQMNTYFGSPPVVGVDAQSNWVAAFPGATTGHLESHLDVDDLLVFDAPLSEQQLVELAKWGRLGYQGQYPERPHPIGAVTTPVQVGPAGFPASDLVTAAVTENDGVLFTEGNPITVGGVTAFAWVKVEQYDAAGAPLLTFGDGLTVAFHEDGVQVACAGAPAQMIAPYKGPSPLGRFQLVAMTTRSGATSDGRFLRFYHDGQALWDGGGTCLPDRVRVREARLNAWSGLFGVALTLAEMDTWLAPGPRLWNATPNEGTALVSGTGTGTLNADGVGELDPTTGAKTVISGGQYANNPGRQRPSGFWGAADASLYPWTGDGDSLAPFTVSFDLSITDNRVLETRIAARAADFLAYVTCDGQNHCNLHLVTGRRETKGGREDVVPLGWYSAKHAVTIAWGENLTIPPAPWDPTDTPAVTSDEPRVTIDGVLKNRRHQKDQGGDRLTFVGSVPPSRNRPSGPYYSRWEFGPGNFGRGMYVYPSPTDPPGAAADFGIDLTDVRVYAYYHPDPQAITPHDRGNLCDEQGRQTNAVSTSAPYHGVWCGECKAGYIEIGGTAPATRECRPIVLFGRTCIADAECGGASCRDGRCTTKDQAICDADCGQIRRACVPSGDSYRCGECLENFAPNAHNPHGEEDWDLTCGWHPTKKGGETCGSDADCDSAWCVPAYSASVETTVNANVGLDPDAATSCQYAPALEAKQVVHPAVCAWASASGQGECTRRGYKSLTEKRFPPGPRLITDGSTQAEGTLDDITAVQCLDGPAPQCAPSFEPRWSVLDPSLCKASLVAASDECGDRWQALRHYDFATLGDKPKLAFLDDGSAYVDADYASLTKAGVGLPLIEWWSAISRNDNPAEMAIREEWGNFLPLRFCATGWPDDAQGLAGAYDGVAKTAYHNGKNVQTCQPILQDNGATCPPAAAGEGSNFAAWQFCASAFCDERGDHTCKQGGNRLGPVAGEAGNGQREGKAAVKFGVVRVDDTRIEIQHDGDNAPALGNDAPRYTIDLSEAYVPCVFGKKFPPIDLLAVDVHIDRSDPKCASSTMELELLGFPLNTPQPSGVAGSCTVFDANAAGSACQATTSCSAPTLDSLKQAASWTNALPSFQVCFPLGDDKPDEGGEGGGEGPKKNKCEEEGAQPCIQKTIHTAIIPIVLEVGLSVDPCISASLGFADTGLPQLEVRPSIGVSVYAKGGVGQGEDETGGLFEFMAGVKIELTLVNIGFPVQWGMDLVDVTDKQGDSIPGLFELDMTQRIAIEVEILGGWMGLFAEFAVGPFSMSWSLKLFGWTGLKAAVDLSNTNLGLWTLDLRALTNAALAGHQMPTAQCNHAPCGGQ